MAGVSSLRITVPPRDSAPTPLARLRQLLVRRQRFQRRQIPQPDRGSPVYPLERQLQDLTDKLDKLAAELPESQWSALPPAEQPRRNMRGSASARRCQRPQKFAAMRWKKDGDLLSRYAYRVCQAGDRTARKRSLSGTGSKGPRNKVLAKCSAVWILACHPPCTELLANQAFYAIAIRRLTTS